MYKLASPLFKSKELLAKYNVNTQPFRVGSTVEELEDEAKRLRLETKLDAKDFELVIKAQILAGGRGKGAFVTSGFKGGVQLTKDLNNVRSIGEKMLNDRLVTIQTPPEGVLVKKVMVAEAVHIIKETYFAILLDRASLGPMLIGSPMGGIDIETVAKNSPDKIYIEHIDITKGLRKEQAERMAQNLGFEKKHIEQASEQIQSLYKLFIEVDALQVEVNPFALTSSGKVMAIDAKIQFDDNAAFRQQAIFNQRDRSEEDPREAAASLQSLNYVGLDGNIGCLVNGAGLAMATMDLIKLLGGSPANFLDVGGNASMNQVKEAFKIITSDLQVKAILVNIFGGIIKCDAIANGIISAAKEISLTIPLIVRLSGTNADQGKQLLKASGLQIAIADDMESAARIAIEKAVSRNQKNIAS